jgi:hypothetical protein
VKRLLSLALLAIVVVPAFLTTACSAGAGHDVPMASVSDLPHQMQTAPVRVREAYQFAVANPDALKNVPCYCGCGSIGHTSNYACYVKDHNADGTLAFDDHALGCSVCVDIAQDVMRLSRDGKSSGDIRSFIVNTYSRFGPPNQ